MAVLLMSDIAGQTFASDCGRFTTVSLALQRAEGVVRHVFHRLEGARVIETWESREDLARFFATNIVPNLPEGIRPKLTFQPVYAPLHPRPKRRLSRPIH